MKLVVFALITLDTAFRLTPNATPDRLLVLDVAGKPDVPPYWEDPEFVKEFEPRGERIVVAPGSRIEASTLAIPLRPVSNQ